MVKKTNRPKKSTRKITLKPKLYDTPTVYRSFQLVVDLSTDANGNMSFEFDHSTQLQNLAQFTNFAPYYRKHRLEYAKCTVLPNQYVSQQSSAINFSPVAILPYYGDFLVGAGLTYGSCLANEKCVIGNMRALKIVAHWWRQSDQGELNNYIDHNGALGVTRGGFAVFADGTLASGVTVGTVIIKYVMSFKDPRYTN